MRILQAPTQIVTSNGQATVEIHLTLDLNISADGLNVSAKARSNSEKVSVIDDDKDSVDWAIPDFGTNERIAFGKDD